MGFLRLDRGCGGLSEAAFAGFGVQAFGLVVGCGRQSLRSEKSLSLPLMNQAVRSVRFEYDHCQIVSV